MRRLNSIVLVATIVMLPAQQILAMVPETAGTQTTQAKPKVLDVAMAKGNALQGQVVDKAGAVVASQPIRLLHVRKQNEVVTAATGKTDAMGRFQFSGLTAGTYVVDASQAVCACRLWASESAPPSAVPQALVVESDQTVRGALGSVGLLGWTLIGLGVAAAIAIPLALDDDGS